MQKWLEIRIISMETPLTEWEKIGSDQQLKIVEAESGRRSEIVRSLILPAIEQFQLKEYHFFNYLERIGPKIESHIRFRLFTDDRTISEIETKLEELKKDGKIHDFEPGIYDPEEDAKERVLKGAPQRLKETIFPDILRAGRWIVVPEEPEQKVEAFEKILRKVVGKCSVAFTEEFKEKPEDAWLISVFVHLLLNSIGYTSEEEKKIRKFPAV